MTRRHGRRTKGFTLVEVIVVLAVVAALLAILTPLVGRYVEDSRVSQAQADVRLIAGAIQTFERDLSAYAVFSTSTKYDERDGDLEILFGPGDNPVVGASDTSQANASGKWPTTSGGVFSAGSLADSLIKHLVTNSIGYPTSAVGVGARRQAFWRGPYLEAIQQDPWGFKYLVVVGGGTPQHALEAKITYVISAGPDGEIDTTFSQAAETELNPVDDDIVYRIR